MESFPFVIFAAPVHNFALSPCKGGVDAEARRWEGLFRFCPLKVFA